MSDKADAVEEVRDRVETTDSVELDELTHDTVREYTNNWEVTDCFDVIDNSERVSVSEIGDRHRQGDLSPASGDTTIERETRYWAGVATVETALDAVDGDTVTETVGV